MGEAMIRGRRTRINYAKDWQYTTNDTATLVTKYIGNKTDVVVPSKINGKPVVLQNSGDNYSTTLLFGERASSIKNIRIKEGVVFNNNDASFAFADCDALISVSGLPKTTANMSNAFYQCTNLVNAPNIPENATDMSCIFQDCVSLINAPTIPSNVTNMSYAFCRCGNLIDAPLIPNEVVDMSGTFSECSNLVNAPTIPTNVTNIYDLFSSCFKLVNAPTIPAKVTNMGYTFSGCSNLIKAPVIPANVTYMGHAFGSCHNLVNAPVIPANVTDIKGIFYNCGKLINAPTIPANITSMDSVFAGCSSLVNAPVIPASVITMYSTFSGCESLTASPSIPSNVTNMRYTFSGCVNLTGNIVIKSNRINNTSMQYCFNNTTLPKNVYIPATGLDATNNTWNAAFNTTYGINGKNGVTVMDEAALDWTYTTNDTATLLTKYTGDKADVVVPTTLAAKPTLLSTGVFKDTSVNSADLQGVNFVNLDMANAFNGCTNLKSVKNMSPYINQANDAFHGCPNLVNVFAKNAQSATYEAAIGELHNAVNMFRNCHNMTRVPDFDSLATDSTNKANYSHMFDNCYNLQSYTIGSIFSHYFLKPDTVDMSYMYANCRSLEWSNSMGLALYGNTNASHAFDNTGFKYLGQMTDPNYDESTSRLRLSYTNLNASYMFANCKNMVAVDFEASGTGSADFTNAFYNCQNLTDVKNIPNGITSANYMFSNCRKLVNIGAFKNDVKAVAFMCRNCVSLKNAVEIPDGVTSMWGTYIDCTNLTNVPITAISLNAVDMDSMFQNCRNLVTAPIIPPNASVRSTFLNCTNLTGNIVIYVNKLTSYPSTFSGTTKAKNVYIYNTNTTSNMWNVWNNTTSGVNGKNGVTLINMGTWENACWEHSGGYTTRYVGSSTEVFVPATLSGQVTTLRHAGRYSSNAPFYSKRLNIKVIKFQSGVKYDSDNMTNAFRDHTGLVAVYGIPSSVTSVWNAFQGCSNLTKVSSIPSSVTQLHNTFAYCTSLVNAPSLKNLTNLTDMEGAFRGCSNLKNIDCIPNKVADITMAFLDCASLVNVPDITNRSVSYFNMRSAFENCKSLVKAPSLTGTNVYAMDNAFKNCSNLKNVPNSLPNSIYIINGAFINCTSLVNAPVIPNGSLTYMVSTFKGCTNLTGNIIIKANGISSSAAFPGAQNCFSNTTLPKNVYIPFQGINTAFNTYNAFKGWNGQNGVTIYDINTYKG